MSQSFEDGDEMPGLDRLSLEQAWWNTVLSDMAEAKNCKQNMEQDISRASN